MNRIAPAGFEVNGEETGKRPESGRGTRRSAMALAIWRRSGEPRPSTSTHGKSWQRMARGTKSYGRGDQTMRHWR